MTTQSKIEVAIGPLAFSGEGEQGWLAEQLDKVLSAVPEISRGQSKGQTPQSSHAGESGSSEDFNATLASYIKEKGGETNQVDRFLITADWLRRRGSSKLTTAAVNKALKDNHQKKLANGADCLNKNVSKGNCEKADGGFYITPDGLKKLGHQ